MKFVLLTGFILFGVFTQANAQDNPPHSLLSKTVPSFSLPNIFGEMISPDNFQNAKGFVVVFTCNHCPFAKLYSHRLNALQRTYAKRGVFVLAINSMDTSVYDDEGLGMMQQRAKTEKFIFNYLRDASQSVARRFGATHTPQAFIIWKEDDKWIIKYCGAIDNNGQEPSKATAFVANALNDLLADRKVVMPESESIGCAINFRETAASAIRTKER